MQAKDARAIGRAAPSVWLVFDDESLSVDARSQLSMVYELIQESARFESSRGMMLLFPVDWSRGRVYAVIREVVKRLRRENFKVTDPCPLRKDRQLFSTAFRIDWSLPKRKKGGLRK